MIAENTTTTSTTGTDNAHDALVTLRSVSLSRSAPRCDPSDYQTDPILRGLTKKTRRVFGGRGGRSKDSNSSSSSYSNNSNRRSLVPLSWQHGLRDGGGFKKISDALVTSLAVPMGALANPTAAVNFARLSSKKNLLQLRYGDHPSQFIDVFLPPSEDELTTNSKKRNDHKQRKKRRARGMVFFVHGGAWGSGKPWFYRLVALPFLEAGLAVAIVGYRVYPSNDHVNDNGGRDNGGVGTQLDDLESAFAKLTTEFPDWCDKNYEERFVGAYTPEEQHRNKTAKHPHHLPHFGTIVIGHSSGAHISLLWIVERLERKVLNGIGKDTDNTVPIDSFVGISGVYNVGHHFDYEAGRGVEEISPLKPANGSTRRAFQRNTPAWKVQHELLRTMNEMEAATFCKQKRSSPGVFPNKIFLVHGAEDTVVPFTSTGEAARLLKQSLWGGFTNNSGTNVTIDECYFPKTGHEDTVVDLMMLGGHKGPVTRTVLEWLLKGNGQDAMQSKL